MLLHTQAERGPVGLTGPIAIPVNCQRTRSYELVGRTIRTYRPSPQCRFALRPEPVSLRYTLPVTWRAAFSRQAQNKKAF